MLRAVERLHFLYPFTPDDLVMVTYEQPPQKMKLNGGGYYELPEVAVFQLSSRNPRYPQFDLATRAAVYMSRWREVEAERKHFVSGDTDEVAKIAEILLPRHMQTLANLQAMTPVAA